MIYKKSFFIFSAIFITFFIVLYFNNIAREKCSLRLEKKELIFGDILFEVEIADTHKAKECGLSYRKELQHDAGMLFVFEKSDFHGIWMKEMRFSIDIIWLDENFYVIDLQKNISPESYPTIFIPQEKTWYVLELNAGSSEEYSIHIGEKFIF